MAQGLSQRRLTSETHILKLISHGAPMTDVLNELCNFIDAKSPGVVPAILLLDSDGVHLRLAAAPTVPKIWNEAFEGLKVPSHGSPDNTSGHQEKTALLTDMRSEPAFAACWRFALSQGAQAAWSVPILSKDRNILGTLILFYATPQPPGERDLELMEQVIHLAAIAIEYHRNEESVREFSRRLYRFQDEERRRIARELHDSTGQKLAVLDMNLSMAKNKMTRQSSEFEGILLECAALTRNISDEIRTLSYLLHPPLLDECGLHTAIEWYVSGINQRNGLRVEAEITKEFRRLSEEAELAIFRIVQASLTNVHLHSRARRAKVTIEQDLDGVIVAVTDDGQGIPHGVLDHSSRTKSVGIGITGMRERIEQLGGRLEIETSRKGTRVKATVPNRHFRTMPCSAAAQTA